MPPQPTSSDHRRPRDPLPRGRLAPTPPAPSSASELSEIELAALLGALAARGETAAEIAGFVDAMRAAATPVPLNDAERAILVDTCGTGGDSSGTFNISTAAALVAAAAGATVAKHGNRAVTSHAAQPTSSKPSASPSISPPPRRRRSPQTSLRLPPRTQPAPGHEGRHARPPRPRHPHHLQLVGPLSNPAGAAAQVMGVYAPHLVPLVAEAMALLGTRHAFVVHGDRPGSTGGLDELSISGPSQIAEVRNGSVTLSTLTPEDVGLHRASIETLRGGDAETNAAILTAIFAGERSPRRDIVLLNAAAVLVASDLASTLTEGAAKAAHAIDSGAVKALLAELRIMKCRTEDCGCFRLILETRSA